MIGKYFCRAVFLHVNNAVSSSGLRPSEMWFSHLIDSVCAKQPNTQKSSFFSSCVTIVFLCPLTWDRKENLIRA